MSNGFEPAPIGLRAPRIPFDLRCVILAAMGLLTVAGANWALGKALDVQAPLSAAVMEGVRFLGLAAPGPAMTWWKLLVSAAAFLAIWAFFGGALLRASALRITRDEPMSIGEALRFGCRNWVTYLSAPLIVILFAGFFVLCNMAAGLIMSLWGVGSSILVVVLFPLALISSLLITLSVLGGLVTLPLMWAAISVEQNGALEAVSRTFSYLFARPFRFFFGSVLIALLALIVLSLSGRFEDTLKRTLKAGITRTSMDDLIGREPQSVEVLQNPYLNADKTQREASGIGDLRNIGDAAWYDKPGVFWMWLLLSVFLYAFKGYAAYIVLGGTVSLYLQLRHDVDGALESEIYPPPEDEDLDGTVPKWVGEAAQEDDTEKPQDDRPENS